MCNLDHEARLKKLQSISSNAFHVMKYSVVENSLKIAETHAGKRAPARKKTQANTYIPTYSSSDDNNSSFVY